MVWGLFNFAVSGYFCQSSCISFFLWPDLILYQQTIHNWLFSLMAPVCYINITVSYSQNCCLWILYILLLVLLTDSLGSVALQDFIPQKVSFNYLGSLATSHMPLANGTFVKREPSHSLRCCDFCQLCTLLLPHPGISHVLFRKLILSLGLKQWSSHFLAALKRTRTCRKGIRRLNSTSLTFPQWMVFSFLAESAILGQRRCLLVPDSQGLTSFIILKAPCQYQRVWLS